MKRLLIVCVCILAIGLMTEKAFGQASYCKDYLENGNPGGTAGLKTFEEEAPYSTTESRFIDIWVCDLRPDPIGVGNELLISGGFEIVYDPSITVVDITIYTDLNGGSWDSLTSFVIEVPGENKIEVGMAQLSGVLPDVDNDVILAKLEVQGTGTITFSPIENFDTIVSARDGFVYDPEIIPNVFTVGGCTIDGDCDDGAYCTGVESCNPVSDLCETTGNPCTPPAVCNEAGDVCDTPECTVDGDCDDGIGCTDDTCDAGVCVRTPNDSNCPDDGTFCNGIEFCDAVLDCSSPGDPCPPLLCDEGLDICAVDCLGDGDCDDGIGCTDDICDAGVCVSTPNDANCDDGVACTDDTCDAGSCVYTPNDGNCPDDGTFCNGIEFCDATNDCSSAGDPCPPLLCDDGSDACVDCLVDGDCANDGVGCTDETCEAGTCVSTLNDANCPDDGAFCNGTEFCDAALDCSSTGNPCPGQSCNESSDQCFTTTTTSTGGVTTTTTAPSSECTTDEECNDDNSCTDDVCDAGSCSYSPLDDGTECDDDGVYCNGIETCVEGSCQSGVNPCPQDQECNEEEDICEDRVGIEVSTGAVGSPFFFVPGIVTIQGIGTDFTWSGSVVTYDSPLVLKGLKLVNATDQTIRQIILLWPSIIFPALNYPAVVTVTVDGLSDEVEVGSFFSR